MRRWRGRPARLGEGGDYTADAELLHRLALEKPTLEGDN